MEPTNTSPLPATLVERFNKWLQESIMIKLFSIGFLILILLIPGAWIQDLIVERQERAGRVMEEVASKWSGTQTVAGPVLVIPYKKQEIIDRGKDGVEIREHIERAYFLPEKLGIAGTVSPEKLHRGIFEAAVYRSQLDVSGSFNKPDFQKLGIEENRVVWKDAYLAYGISDQRGISENPVIAIGSDTLTAEPSNQIGVTVVTSAPSQQEDRNVIINEYETESAYGITAKLPWATATDFQPDFKMKLSLKGSHRLNFVPAGKTTDVQLAGPWKDPSFDGKFLPEHRELTEESFTADWKVLHFNRPFAQQWVNDAQKLSGADFGVTLLIPVDQYMKSIRTSKYGVLIILLTFMALFLVEITQKIRIHPFQYILIGSALTIYYTLLLSISEHTGYNIGYMIASAATVALVALYSHTFFRERRLSMLFAALLTLFYLFIFVIILQQDYALLIGSIGLFAIIGTLMYFSRNVNWYAKS